MSAAKSGIKVTASDALEFEPVSAPRQGSGRGLRFLMLLLVLGACGAGWFFYGDRVIRLVGDSTSAVPILRAEAGPVKVRPENPGGLEIPDRDKLVYSRIQGGGETDANSGIERLLPPPETLLPKPQPVAAVPEPSPPVQQAVVEPVKVAEPAPEPEQVAALTPTPEPVAPAAPRTTSVPLPQAKPKPSAAVPSENDVAALQPPTKVQPAAVNTDADAPAPSAEPIPAPPPPPAAPTTPVETAPAPAMTVATSTATAPPAPAAAPVKATSSAAYRVQLAAARSPEAVEQEWVRLRKQHLDLLGNLGLGITKADLGIDKGVFYRLRIGPIVNERAARKLCADLAKRKVGCLIIKPSG